MKRALVAALAASLIIVSCGEVDPAPDAQAFCEFMARGHETGSPPDADAFEKLEELAPKEIRRRVSVGARLFREKGSDAFNDPEFQRVEVAVEEWEAKNCHGAGHAE
jgi:hypothetical protein